MWLPTCLLEEEVYSGGRLFKGPTSLEGRFDTIKWVEFMDMFKNTYYPKHVREQKGGEFTNLKQDKVNKRIGAEVHSAGRFCSTSMWFRGSSHKQVIMGTLICT